MNTVSFIDAFPAASEPDSLQIDFEDAEIQCVDCGKSFVWSAGEQHFYHQKELRNPPKRCRTCKKAKNDRIEAAARSADGEKERINVRVTCDECNETTTVPFYPSQGRPVYCRDCYQSKSNMLAAGDLS